MNEPRVNFSTNGAKAPIPSTSASTPVCPVVMPGRHQRCWQPSANISEMAPASSPEKLWRETRGNLVVNFTDKSHFLLEPVQKSPHLLRATRDVQTDKSASRVPPVNNAFEVVLASDDGSRLRRWLRSIVRWTSFGPLAKASELLRMIRSSPAEQLEAPLPGCGEASACAQMQQHGRVRPCSTAPSRRRRGIADRMCAPLHFPSRSEGDRRPGCAPLATSPNTNKSWQPLRQ